MIAIYLLLSDPPGVFIKAASWIVMVKSFWRLGSL